MRNANNISARRCVRVRVIKHLIIHEKITLFR